MPAVPEPTLEVIALSAADALAAARGGGDRLEVVRDMAADGLSPTVAVIAQMRNRTPLPLRVMLRANAGFVTSPVELATLCQDAAALRAAGVDQFVFGLLTVQGDLDCAALATLSAAIAPCPWTLHRAFDHTVDARRAWDASARLPGLDLILSAGAPTGLAQGIGTLCERAHWQTASVRWLAGGGLRSEHIPRLRVAGITQFHAGRAARHDGRWDQRVSEEAVRRLKTAISGAVS